MSTSLEDLLNSDSDDNNEDAGLDLKDLDLEQFLKDDDDEDDPAVLSSAIYEQFSHLMKTNENIQKELATPAYQKSIEKESRGKSIDKNDFPEEEEFPEDSEYLKLPAELLSFEQDENEASRENSPVPINSSELPGLKQAEVREQKALHYIEKSNISALQIRRTGPGSVMTGLEELSLITNQLKKNGSYQQHGPGTATTISICPKFVAIGTAKGFILIFDHHQEIRKVLTHPTPVKTTTGMAIVGLDALSDGSLIVSAHRMGDILFWDCAKGVLLKQIKDPSGAELVSLRFLRNVGLPDNRNTVSLSESDSFHVIGFTSNSVVNRYRLSKSLLSTWHVDIDCLLDESSGPLLCSSILPPFSLMDGSPSSHEMEFSSKYYSDLRKQRGVVQLFAFSFHSQTCVVQSSPEVRFVFKWTKTNSNQFESKDSRELLDWNWMKMPNEANTSTAHLFPPNYQLTAKDDVMLCPVLTRVREDFIELLVIRVKRTTSSSSNSFSAENTPRSTTSGRSSILMFSPFNLTGGGAAEEIPSLSFEFIPWVNKRVPYQADHILAIKWIKTSHLIAFTKTEILLFDSSLNCLEKCLLFAPISNGFIATAESTGNPSNTTEMKPEVSVLNGEGFILTSLALFKTFTRSPFEQANSLISSGRWLEGLSLIVENITKSPALLVTEAEHIRRYIINYTLLAVKRTAESSKGTSVTAAKQSKNHFHLVASVCTEYCVATKQFTLLFQEIMDVFRVEHQHFILLESFEPFLLNGSITALPLLVLFDYLQIAAQEDKLPVIEKCLVAMNPKTLMTQPSSSSSNKPISFEEILYFLYSHQIFSPFLYYYSTAFQNFSGAFQFIFQFVLSEYDRQPREPEQESEEPREEVLYKLLLFALFTFEGKIFPKGTSNSDEKLIDSSDKRSKQGKSENKTQDDESQQVTLARILNGLDVNAVFSLLSFLTNEELSEEMKFPQNIVNRQFSSSFSAANGSFSLESHYLKTIEYPLLTFFFRFDFQSLFSVLLKGLENLISCFSSIGHGGQLHSSSANHLFIATAEEDESKQTSGEQEKEKIFYSKEMISLPMKQKNENKLMALLYKLFLFSEKEQQETASASSSSSSSSLPVSVFFKTFAHLLVSLPNATVSVDLITALVGYFHSQILKTDFSPLKCEEQLKVLLENQMKLLSGNNTKFNVFAEKVQRIVFENEFFACHFFVRRCHPKLFSSSSVSNAANDFTRQIRHYINLYKTRTKDSNSQQQSKLAKFPTSASATFVSNSKEKDTLELSFRFIFDALDYLEKEKDNSVYFPDNSLLLKFKEQVLSLLLELLDLSIEQTIQKIILPFFLFSSVLPVPLAQSSQQSQLQSHLGAPPPSSSSTVAPITPMSLLIEPTRKNSQLQFHFLQELIQQLQSNATATSTYFSIRQYFKNPESLYFLRLHCSYSPETVLLFLKQFVFSGPPPLEQQQQQPEKEKERRDSMILTAIPRDLEESFPLDEMAAVLKEFPATGISDAVAFFEEKFGHFDDALHILLRDFSGRMKTVRKEIDAILRQETASSSVSSASAGSHSLLLTRGSLSQLLLLQKRSSASTTLSGSTTTPQVAVNEILKEMASQLPACRSLRYSMTLLSDLCERQSPNPSGRAALTQTGTTGGEQDNNNNETQRTTAERLWCTSFDHFLKERRK
jgi:hypothetical protein